MLCNFNLPLNFLIVFIHISEISRTVGKMMRTKGLSKMQEESLLWLGKLITYYKKTGPDLVLIAFMDEILFLTID